MCVSTFNVAISHSEAVEEPTLRATAKKNQRKIEKYHRKVSLSLGVNGPLGLKCVTEPPEHHSFIFPEANTYF